MSAISLLQEDANWRSRKVQYSAGDWDAIQTVLPEFDLVPCNAGQDEPNPFLRTVMRRPLTAAERPIPVAVVSRNYAPHRHVAALCREGLIKAGIEPADLRYEVGLSELGEWMNFCIYFADSYSFTDVHGNKLALRLEWFQFRRWLFTSCDPIRLAPICLCEWLGHRRNQNRNQRASPSKPATPFDTQAHTTCKADRAKMKKWQAENVVMDDIKAWTDGKLSEQWGKKAAARVFHICDSGMDVEIDPFEPGAATAKPIRYLDCVPGSPQRAATKYDVMQGLSYVATHRNNTEERLSRQGDIHRLLERLRTSREIKGGLIADRAV